MDIAVAASTKPYPSTEGAKIKISAYEKVEVCHM